MNNRNKVLRVSTIKGNIKNTIEKFTYTMSSIVGLLAFELSIVDIIPDGYLNTLHNYPKAYSTIVLSPLIIGALIKKLDPNSETAQDINKMINQLNPKHKVRTK